MQGFVCVYRRYLPKNRDLEKTKEAAAADPALDKFLREYKCDERFYDWGDDPAFFAAQEFLGNVRQASWGVCRPDVRSRLNLGDLLVFFCAQSRLSTSSIWYYYYIGFGTVSAAISRCRLWGEDQFESYRQFYNVLCEIEGSTLAHKETFHPHHRDWEKRSRAPYIVFEPDDGLTHFNLSNPLHVATYDGTAFPEVWKSGCSELAARLERLVFIERDICRRLRSSPTGCAHQYINLVKKGTAIRPGRSLQELRSGLLELSETVAT